MDRVFTMESMKRARGRTDRRAGDTPSKRLRIVPLAAVLALSLALSACDRCGDYFWQQQGSCKAGPAPN
jgi:hypothetical protein